MKRLLVFVLSLLSVFSLTGCFGSSKGNSTPAGNAGSVGTTAISTGGSSALPSYASNELDYNQALELYVNGNYAEAIEIFSRIGDYKSSLSCLAKAQAALASVSVAGTWVSEPFDVTDQYVRLLDPLGFGTMDLTDAGRVTGRIVYELHDDGTALVGFSAEQLSEYIDKLVGIYRSNLSRTAEAELYIAAEDYGISAIDVLISLGLESSDEYLEQELGMSLDSFCETLRSRLSSQLQNGTSVSGVYSADGDRLEISTGDITEIAVYDDSSHTITLTGEGQPAENQGNFPIVLTRLSAG